MLGPRAPFGVLGFSIGTKNFICASIQLEVWVAKETWLTSGYFMLVFFKIWIMFKKCHDMSDEVMMLVIKKIEFFIHIIFTISCIKNPLHVKCFSLCWMKWMLVCIDKYGRFESLPSWQGTSSSHRVRSSNSIDFFLLSSNQTRQHILFLEIMYILLFIFYLSTCFADYVYLYKEKIGYIGPTCAVVVSWSCTESESKSLGRRSLHSWILCSKTKRYWARRVQSLSTKFGTILWLCLRRKVILQWITRVVFLDSELRKAIRLA